MRIGCDVTGNGLLLRVDDRSFAVTFPEQVWQAFPHKEAFADNYAFIKTLHLPWMLGREFPLQFDTKLPLFRHSLFMAMVNNVPYCADMDGLSVGEQLRRLLAQEFSFAGDRATVPTGGRATSAKAIVNMSLGKDSLLTWAIARELGLEPVLYYNVEADCPREYAYKADIAARFSAEFGEPIHVVKNETGVIHRPAYWGKPHTEWGFGHLITEHALLALPFAWAHGARYVLLGNERECDEETYFTRDGFKAWSVYDQTHDWALELTNIAGGLTASKVQITSLIKPLYELGIMGILHRRYPEAAKYQMSCFPDENDFGRDSRWCGHCTKCARNFAYMLATGVDPNSVGLHTNMLASGHLDHFSLFSATNRRTPVAPGDVTTVARDEQMFALLLAHERGMDGPVMEIFRERHLEFAQQHRDELRSRFLGVHDGMRLPDDLHDRVLSLFRTELGT